MKSKLLKDSTVDTELNMVPRDEIVKILQKPFFSRDALVVAKELLGKLLVRRDEQGELIGKIVEVEAYKGKGDQASHAYKGETQRNKVLFEGPGLAYVYFVYGNYFCLNVTTNERGVVLIRALEPIKGTRIMQKRRGVRRHGNLTNGPGKLTQAMNITKDQYGIDLTKGSELFICDPQKKKKRLKIVSSKRIGIRVAVEKPWRFYIEGNKFISRK